MSYDGHTAPRSRVEFAPAPQGFDLQGFPDFGVRDSRAASSKGLRHWLSHAQLDVSGSEPVHTQRSLVQVTSNDGLQAAAKFDATFNPRFERLIIHGVRVHRNGATREVARPEAFEIIQRELNMERAVFDGRMTAHMVIPDVREGDLVETIYSTVGANPVLQGRLSWWFTLQWGVEVHETRCTLKIPKALPLRVRSRGMTVAPTDTADGGVRTLDWRAIDLPLYSPEPGSPPSYVGYASVHVAEEITWAQVADTFRLLYPLDAPLPGNFRSAVAKVAETKPTAEAQVVDILRLVQIALRYHSVSVGEGGYRPRAVAEIWETRYGDCKDASLLLASALRSAGIDAVCALVNTVIGDDLPDQPPNVLAFDHCVVRARVGNRTVWLDATSPPQAGDLDHITQAAFHWALPLEAGAILEAMAPRPMVDICDVHEVWTFARERFAPAKLNVSTIYRAWRADGMRRAIANEAPQSLANWFREALEREINSPLVEVEPMRIEDNATDNVLRIVEAYDVERPYRDEEGGRGEYFASRDDLIGPQLARLGPELRREPLQLGLPRRLTTKRTFHFPIELELTSTERLIEGPAGLTFKRSYRRKSPTQGVLELTLTVPKMILPARDSQEYEDFVRRAEASNGISFPVVFKRGRMGRQTKTTNGGAPWWAIGAGLFILLNLFRLLAGG